MGARPPVSLFADSAAVGWWFITGPYSATHDHMSSVEALFLMRHSLSFARLHSLRLFAVALVRLSEKQLPAHCVLFVLVAGTPNGAVRAN